MRVGIYTICKNEEKTIKNTIDSVIRDAAEVVVVDTGSTDNTIQILEEYAKQYNNFKFYKAFIHPWRFDDAKNMALSLLSLDIDICISLDADEYMCDGWFDILKNNYDEHITRYHHSFKTYWADGSTTTHYHDRIHSRLDYKWTSPIHEYLEFKTRNSKETIKMVDSLWMYQTSDTNKNREYYYDMLKIAIKEHPDTWRLRVFYASECIKRNDVSAALAEYDIAETLKDTDKTFIYASKAELYNLIGNRDFAAKYSFLAATNDNIREYWLLAAKYALSDLEKEQYLNKAKSITDVTRGYKYNEAAWV